MTNELIPAEGYLSGPENPAIARVVPIRIDGSLYGVPVAQAGDMVVLSSVVPVALAPASVRGVLNRQGRMATVIETRLALGGGQTPTQASTPPLIGLSVEQDGHLYILAVDEVREITDLADARETIAPLDIGAIVSA
jgi:chemotaxis signal transduction protein